MIHRIPVTLRILEVKSDKSDWLRVRNEFYAYAQKIGSGPSSRFLMLSKRSAASGTRMLVRGLVRMLIGTWLS